MRKLSFIAAAGGIVFCAFAWKPAQVPGRDLPPMLTKWGESLTPENAWSGYPRPQMVRNGWTNLNGLWEYAVTSNAAWTTAVGRVRAVEPRREGRDPRAVRD